MWKQIFLYCFFCKWPNLVLTHFWVGNQWSCASHPTSNEWDDSPADDIMISCFININIASSVLCYWLHLHLKRVITEEVVFLSLLPHSCFLCLHLPHCPPALWVSVQLNSRHGCSRFHDFLHVVSEYEIFQTFTTRVSLLVLVSRTVEASLSSSSTHVGVLWAGSAAP